VSRWPLRSGSGGRAWVFHTLLVAGTAITRAFAVGSGECGAGRRTGSWTAAGSWCPPGRHAGRAR
jgi:hypothetical protein